MAVVVARDLEARGRARATITRRLCTVAGFYRYAVEEELLDHRRLCRRCRPVTRRKDHLPGQHRPGRRPLQLLEDHRATPANRKLAGVAALADHLDLLPRRHLYS